MAARKRYDRREELLAKGAALVSQYGQKNVTRRMVAKSAKVSDSLVSSYFGTTEQAQRVFAKHAKLLKLPLLTKEESDAMGAELRKKPRKKKRRAAAVVPKRLPSMAKFPVPPAPDEPIKPILRNSIK